MIQRLIDSLHALAAPAERQRRRFDAVDGSAEQLAREFDDAFLLIRDCPQMMLTYQQQDALIDLDLTLTAMERAAGSQAWTDEALRENRDWEVVRRQAAAALEALGAPSTDHHSR